MSELQEPDASFFGRMSDTGRVASTHAIRIVGLSFLWLWILAFLLGLPSESAFSSTLDDTALPFLVSSGVLTLVAAILSKQISKGYMATIGTLIAALLGTFGTVEIGMLTQSLQLHGAFTITSWFCVGACCTSLLISWLCMIALSRHDIAATTVMLSLSLSGVCYLGVAALASAFAHVLLSALPLASMVCFRISLKLMNQPYDELPDLIEENARSYVGKLALSAAVFGFFVGLSLLCFASFGLKGCESLWFAGAALVASLLVFAAYFFGKSENRIAVCFQLSPIIGILGLLPFLIPGHIDWLIAALAISALIPLGFLLVFVMRLPFFYEVAPIKILSLFVAMSMGGAAIGLALGAFVVVDANDGVMCAIALIACFVCSIAVVDAKTIASILRGNTETEKGRRFSSWKDAVNSISESYSLTPRESEILLLLSRGKNAKTIANYFVIAEGTVKSHMYRIYKKVGVANQQELIELIEDTLRKSRSV